MAGENEGAPVAKKKGGKLVPMMVITLLMLGEGFVVYFVASAMAPAPMEGLAADGSGDGGSEGDSNEVIEIELAESTTNNRRSGKLVNFRLRVTGLVKAEDEEEARELVKIRQARLLDRINYVVRSAEPLHLDEPELKTIRRRLKQEFDAILGEGVIVDVIIPEYHQSSAGL